MVTDQSFRAGVVVVVRHPDRQRVLAFARAQPVGEWLFPQGGLHEGEEPHEGAWRELAEETALTSAEVELVAEHPVWTLYEWPAELRHADARGRRGQAQRWFLFQARDEAIEPVPDGRELIDWCWERPSWVIDRVVAWRRGPYAAVLPGWFPDG